MTNSGDMRKYLNVISEDGPLAPGVFGEPDALPVADPIDTFPAPDMGDEEATGAVETKIEVTMKDGDEVEVEVYAKQGDELNRIMDLAGMFHKDKQSGTLASMDDATPDMTPDIPTAPEMSPSDDDFDMNYGDDAVSPFDAPVSGGPDVPVGTEIGDVGMDDDAQEIEFDMADDIGAVSDPDDDIYEDNTKKHDFGYPNPQMGQEEYELSAYAHAGGASKPVRFVPARSGDNPMVNTSERKGLKEYIDEVGSTKKKVIDENLADDAADATVANLAAGVKVDDATQKKLKKVAKDTQQGANPDDDNSEKMDDVLDAADAKGVTLNPNQKRELKKNVVDQQKNDSISETDLKMSIVDEEELEERKRRYSFSHAEFGKGIITSPAAKRKRAARRGLSIYKK